MNPDTLGYSESLPANFSSIFELLWYWWILTLWVILSVYLQTFQVYLNFCDIDESWHLGLFWEFTCKLFKYIRTFVILMNPDTLGYSECLPENFSSISKLLWYRWILTLGVILSVYLQTLQVYLNFCDIDESWHSGLFWVFICKLFKYIWTFVILMNPDTLGYAECLPANFSSISELLWYWWILTLWVILSVYLQTFQVYLNFCDIDESWHSGLFWVFICKLFKYIWTFVILINPDTRSYSECLPDSETDKEGIWG